MAGSTDGSSNNGAGRPTMRAPQAAVTPNDFLYGKLLGLGSYSKVVKVKQNDTGEVYALKMMDKKHIIRENKVKYVKMERMILDQLDFPGVIRLYFTFQDTYFLYMGLECCNGGELFDQIRRKGQMSIEDARFYAAEIIDILEYIHGQGVIHRDLKPENLLFTTDGHLKLCDFGSAKMVRPLSNGFFQADPDEKTCTFVGTAEYVSPEVLTSNPVNYGVDLWALGCIIYQMLDGRPPFKAGTEYLTFQKVMAREFVMPSHFTAEAKDLVDRLLDLKPDRRLGAQGYDELKNHPFLAGIDWSRLRSLPAPVLARAPQSATADESDEGSADSDWDMLGTTFAHLGICDSSSESANPGESSSAVFISSSPTSSDSSYGRSPAPSYPVPLPSFTQSVPLPATPTSQLSSLDEIRKVRSEGRLSYGSLADDCHLEQWKRFLQPGESLVATSLVKKHRNLLTKKLQLLLIDTPRLIYVDTVRLAVAGEIPWSLEMRVKVENPYKWKIVTPNRTYNLEDLRGQAWQWKDVIEDLQR